MKKTTLLKQMLALTVLPVLLTGCLYRPVNPPYVDTDTGSETRIDAPLASETTGIPVTDPVFDETTTDPLPVEPEPVTTVSFVGCGDNIVYFGNVRDAQSQAIEGGRTYNFMPAYTSIAERISGADIAFINQETLMTGDEFSYYPQFNGPQDMAYDLVELGFDVINLANNHMLDKYSTGYQKNLDFWHTMDVTTIGGYYDAVDFDTIRVTEVKGIKIAWLSYTYGTNGMSLPASSSLVVPYLSDADITRQVALAKEAGDLVFVSVHWGDENFFQPNAEQKHYAQLMADLGVDAVIGHHPHVIQPVEWLTGADGNTMLCVYSLGNLMAEMARDFNMVGGMITFDIVKVGDSKPTLDNVVFIPTVFDFPGNFYNNHVYYLEDYTDSQGALHGVRTYYSKHYGYSNDMSMEHLISIVKSTVAGEFLPAFYQ